MLESRTQVGPYRVERLLGRGGMAIVYEATQPELGRRVALKVLAPETHDVDYIERFRNEGRMQAALVHPNIVTVFESGDSEHGPFLALQLIEGTTLAGLIDDGALDARRTLDLLGQVAEALDAAHAAGYVHRDIKPRNILVGKGDHAYLADFGLTRSADTAGVTLSGAFMGTLAYVAPEVVEGRPATAASDRYALAAVLFECLTGTVVFPRTTHAAILYAHTSEPPPRVSGRRPEVPPALDDVLVAGLAKNPSRRPASARELIDAARAALGSGDLGPPAPRSLEPLAASAAETTSARVPRQPPDEAGVPNPPMNRVRVAAAGVVLAVTSGLVGGVVTRAIAGDPDGAPATPAGMVRLGSALADPGRTAGCDGRAVRGTSPSCSLLQEKLPNGTLPVPRDGVIRRWNVRSASGEIALSVLRPRDNDFFQIARSRNEFVNGTGVQTFNTDLAVEEGDRLALVVLGGSGAGFAPAPGLKTLRWSPMLSGKAMPHAAGPGGELLMGADLLPGGKQHAPRTLVGAAAAAEPDGTTITQEHTAFHNGSPVTLRLASVNGHGVLDAIEDGKRTARTYVPDMAGDIEPDVVMELYVHPTRPRQVGIWVEFKRVGSSRSIGHYFDMYRKIVYVN